jgi:hypothetical protein
MSTSGGSAGAVTAIPTGATPLHVSSANVANAAAVATLPNVAGKTTYITGLEVTASGATAGLAVTVTVAGPTTTLNYTFTFPTGATVGAAPLVIELPEAIPASAVNTAIVVTLPASGAGGTNATVVAHGYQL